MEKFWTLRFWENFKNWIPLCVKRRGSNYSYPCISINCMIFECIVVIKWRIKDSVSFFCWYLFFFGFFYGCSFFRLTYFTPIFSFCTRCFLMYPGGYRKETVAWNGRVTLIFFWDSLLLLKNVPPTYRSTSVLRKWANSY